MTTAELAARLIQVFEGCRFRAYWDKTGKVWTIGFGHTRTAKQGMVITQAEADRLFVEDIEPLLKLVTGYPLIEAAAYVSFGYNCGAGALKRLLAGAITFNYGKTSGGVRLDGLVARRELERALVLASQFTKKPAKARKKSGRIK